MEPNHMEQKAETLSFIMVFGLVVHTYDQEPTFSIKFYVSFTSFQITHQFNASVPLMMGCFI